MLKALISTATTAVLAAFMASASAYSDASDQPPPTIAGTLAGKAPAEKSTRMKLQPDTETVKVRAVYSPNIRPNPTPAFAADDGQDGSESGWRSYGMLLATLVLMAVIAVRRYKAGRP